MSARHASLAHGPCDLIGGRAVPLSGAGLHSHDPARPERTIWQGSPVLAHVDEGVAAARRAFAAWSTTARAERFALLRRFQDIARLRVDQLAELICDEVGKPIWESRQEAEAIAAKVDITLDDAEHAGLRRVHEYEFELGPSRRARCTFRPHGVMAVIGPFNFPAHLPNGHIVPALAMGNTVVLKPSDKAPAVGQLLGEMLHEAGLPPGVVNVVQGGADVAAKLVSHADIDGVLFTGSWPVGRKILEANLDRPSRIVALELGGSNPAVIMDDADLRQASIECARCAFNTTGQRCTSTRRVIVHERVADKVIAAICRAARELAIGDPRGAPGTPGSGSPSSGPPGSCVSGHGAAQPVFMGPIIRDEARRAVLAFQREAVGAGGEAIVEAAALDGPELHGGHYISAGVMRVERFTLATGAGRDAGCDVEIFGPLLRISVARDFDDALEQANATRYGLAASIFTRSEELAGRFVRECRAGCVNVNTGTAGASGKLPFGGVGLSGNHRPAGAFSLDYCAYPVAHMLETSQAATIAPGMRFEDSWLV